MSDNELIARFMGDVGHILSQPKWRSGDELIYLKYHKSWDWLMMVVQKIESTEFAPTRVKIDCNECTIIGKKRFKVHTISKINSTYKCIVQFIQWYNQQKS